MSTYHGGKNMDNSVIRTAAQPTPTMTEQSTSWTTPQVYSLSIICLLLGGVLGYLIRAPQTQPADVPERQQISNAGRVSGSPPTPEQLKQMADTKAKPALARLRSEPNNPELLAQLGNVYFSAQQYPTAAQYYERSATLKPNAEVLTLLASTYYYAGSSDTAIDALNRALKLDPNSADALYNLGMLKWKEKNDAKGAIAAWAQLLATNPNHPRRSDVEQAIAAAKEHLGLPADTKGKQ